MVKITFEISEDFIRENANPESASEKIMAAEGKKTVKVLFDMIGFSKLKERIDAGKTEFVVTPDKLDEKSIEMYNNELGEICILAAFSETDKKEEE